MTKLKYWRKKRDITLKELAQRTGYSTVWIWKIENGRITPCYKTIMLLANALNIKSTDLLYPCYTEETSGENQSYK